MIFESIRFKNFCSFGNTWTEIDYQKANSTIISGLNGNGKCLRKNTVVEIKFDDNELEKLFVEFD
jgi:predicted ATP-binding protein involved in virulence